MCCFLYKLVVGFFVYLFLLFICFMLSVDKSKYDIYYNLGKGVVVFFYSEG